MDNSLTIYITITMVLLILLILNGKIKKLNLGRVIVSLPKPFYEHFAILMPILIFYLQIKDIYIGDKSFSSHDTLLLLVNIIISVYGIYISVGRNEICELGIYTKNQVITWDKIVSYEIIDLNKNSKHTNSTFFKLQIKVKLFTIIKKEIYRDVTIKINQNEKEVIIDLLEKVVNV